MIYPGMSRDLIALLIGMVVVGDGYMVRRMICLNLRFVGQCLVMILMDLDCMVRRWFVLVLTMLSLVLGCDLMGRVLVDLAFVFVFVVVGGMGLDLMECRLVVFDGLSSSWIHFLPCLFDLMMLLYLEVRGGLYLFPSESLLKGSLFPSGEWDIRTGFLEAVGSVFVSATNISFKAGPLSLFLMNQVRSMVTIFPNFAAARPPSKDAAFR